MLKRLICLPVLALVLTSTTACVDDEVTTEEVIQPTVEKTQEDDKNKFTVDEKGVVKFEAEIVYFKFDQDTLTDEGMARLDSLGSYLQDNKKNVLQIQGHCDERGSIEYNLALGDRRAESVRKYLANLGIDPKRLKTISYGEEKPAEEGHAEMAWSQNRRADFVLSSFGAE